MRVSEGRVYVRVTVRGSDRGVVGGGRERDVWWGGVEGCVWWGGVWWGGVWREWGVYLPTPTAAAEGVRE